MSGLKQKSGIVECQTTGRGLFDITRDINAWLQGSGFSEGVLTILIQHTSASLTIQENADPDVQQDMLTFYEKLVPDNPALYRHVSEGPDDMPSHIRSSLTDVSLSIPVMEGRMALGIWQGLYIFEHRTSPHRRRLALNFMGS